MQFGFKSNHSTTMCSAIYMEIINEYKMKGSNVHSCMLEFISVHCLDCY